MNDRNKYMVEQSDVVIAVWFRLKQNQIKRLKVRIYLKIELKSNK